MITKNDIQTLYKWAKVTEFPLKKAPTSKEYANKDIYISWLKGVGKTVTIRKKLMTDEVYKIFQNDEILYATYSLFVGGTILKPHRDPNVYREHYKRIQIPLSIPDKEKCYMTWQDKRVYWEEGVAQVYSVMDYLHDGGNISEKPMEFLMIDIKKSCMVEYTVL
jgi:aspartyl/asparaginyl beta-hydroxylase (cupin superfamily)